MVSANMPRIINSSVTLTTDVARDPSVDILLDFLFNVFCDKFGANLVYFNAHVNPLQLKKV